MTKGTQETMATIPGLVFWGVWRGTKMTRNCPVQFSLASESESGEGEEMGGGLSYHTQSGIEGSGVKRI